MVKLKVWQPFDEGEVRHKKDIILTVDEARAKALLGHKLKLVEIVGDEEAAPSETETSPDETDKPRRKQGY